jgi:hypothetical protein
MNRSPSLRTWAGLQAHMSAAAWTRRLSSRRAAIRAAFPPSKVAREATVGPLFTAMSESGRGIWMRSGRTPRVSAAMSVNTVREPVP